MWVAISTAVNKELGEVPVTSEGCGGCVGGLLNKLSVQMKVQLRQEDVCDGVKLLDILHHAGIRHGPFLRLPPRPSRSELPN